MKKKLLAAALAIFGLLLIPILSGLFGDLIDTKKWDIKYVFLILLLIFIIYILLDEYNKARMKIQDINILPEDYILGDLQKKSNIEVVPSLNGITVFEQNNFTSFNITSYSGKGLLFLPIDIDEIKNKIYVHNDTSIIIMGEPGVGKTTLVRWLTTEVAKRSLDQGDSFIPYLIFLSEYNVPTTQVREKISEITRPSDKLNPKRCKLIFLLDGLNEVKKENFLEIVDIIKGHCNQRGFKISLIITTRPLSVDNAIFEVLPKENVKFFYRISEWSVSQVKHYLLNNGLSKEDMESFSSELLQLLKVPLFAYLFCSQRALTGNTNSISSIKDLIENFLLIWLSPQPMHSEFYQVLTRVNGNSLIMLDKDSKRKILEELAFILNSRETLEFRHYDMEHVLHQLQLDASNAIPLIKELVNFGILTNGAVNDTNFLFYKFRHQIFQEYLAASHCLNNNISLEDNIAVNKFWRDVPLYAFLQLTDTIEKKSYLQKFRNTNDYLTFIRIARLKDQIFDQSLVVEAVNFVTKSFEDFDSYAYSSEVIQEAGKIGEETLLSIVASVDATVVAREELELIEETEDLVARAELRWRAVGRSIQILGIIKSSALIKILNNRITEIRSHHLIYHILEYILKSKIYNSYINKVAVLSICFKLSKFNDPIIRSYKSLLLKKLLA